MAEKINILVLEDDEHRITQFRERFFSLFNGKDKDLITGVVEYARTAKEAIEFLKETAHFDVIFLDHDLGDRVFVSSDDENTGSEVVRYLISNSEKYKNTIFIVHSFNQPAAKNMVFNIRKNITNNVKYIPGVWQKEIFKTNIKFSNI